MAVVPCSREEGTSFFAFEIGSAKAMLCSTGSWCRSIRRASASVRF